MYIGINSNYKARGGLLDKREDKSFNDHGFIWNQEETESGSEFT